MKDFENLLKDEGVPVSESEIKQVFKQAVTDSGSKISNDSNYSPFWRLISAIATQPVKYLVDALVQNVMPQFFLKTVGEGFIELWGNNYGVERKRSQRLQGRVIFSREDSEGEVAIPKGTLISSVPLNDKVYQLATLEEAKLSDEQGSISVKVQALEEGGAYNLETGYFQVADITGLEVINPENWIDVLGADDEDIEDYRLRIRNAFNSLSHFHTDGVYRHLIAQFVGVSSNMIWFEHGVTRGGPSVIPGAANAYVLFELDAPSESYIKTLNRMISEEGYHGHGDDLLVMKMPELLVDLEVAVYFPVEFTSQEKSSTLEGIEQAIEAAFRSNSAYIMTQAQPNSRFSLTRLASEVYQHFPAIESVTFRYKTEDGYSQKDIVTELAVPHLNSISVKEEPIW